MNKVFDNGYYLLGKVKSIIEYSENYMQRTSDTEETIYELINELKEDYNKNDIVSIYYDNPMGYTIECFKENEMVYEGED